jgi:hypothetical protein
MSVAIPPLPQYIFMARCSVKAQGQLYIYLLYINARQCSCLNHFGLGEIGCADEGAQHYRHRGFEYRLGHESLSAFYFFFCLSMMWVLLRSDPPSKESGAHPASYPMDTRDSFPGGKATGS